MQRRRRRYKPPRTSTQSRIHTLQRAPCSVYRTPFSFLFVAFPGALKCLVAEPCRAEKPDSMKSSKSALVRRTCLQLRGVHEQRCRERARGCTDARVYSAAQNYGRSQIVRHTTVTRPNARRSAVGSVTSQQRPDAREGKDKQIGGATIPAKLLCVAANSPFRGRKTMDVRTEPTHIHTRFKAKVYQALLT